MRHQVAGKKLSRNVKERKALFKNLINALILHEEVQTTEAKAKAVRGLADKIIAKGKKGTLNARRIIAAFLQNTKAVNKIVDDLAVRFKDRASGFTRIIRVGSRRGDNAMIVKMELVEKKEEEKKKEDAKAKLEAGREKEKKEGKPPKVQGKLTEKVDKEEEKTKQEKPSA